MTSQTSLHERLRSLRHQAHFTLAEVSDRCGVSLSFLSDMERGRSWPSLLTVERIGLVYGLSLGEMLANVTMLVPGLEPERTDVDRQPCWSREIQTADGNAVVYRAHAASDPETMAMLDELVKAAAQHMRGVIDGTENEGE